MRRGLAWTGAAAVLVVIGLVAMRSVMPSEGAVAAILTEQAILEDPHVPKVAPEGYDVTVVLFSDYQCPACRKAHPAVQQLIANDPKVRVVYRDWPIFGGASTEAARAAIASQWQGKHAAFNDALMRTPGRLSSRSIKAAALAAGVDWHRLQADLTERSSEIDSTISRTNMQAAALGLQGTPSFLIGPYIVSGGLDPAGMREAVALARAKKSAS